MDIARLIPEGKGNAVTREELCKLTGFSDREIRKLIEIARNDGAIIINDSDGKGYYQSNNAVQIRRQILTNNSRAMSILKQQKHLRKRLKELEEQDDYASDIFACQSADCGNCCAPDHGNCRA